MTVTAYEILTDAHTKAYGDGLYEHRGTLYHLSPAARLAVHDRCVEELDRLRLDATRMDQQWVTVVLALACVGAVALLGLLAEGLAWIW